MAAGRPLLAMLGRSDRRLSEALCRHLPSEVTPGPGGLLGLELEFSVRSGRGDRVHFGSLIHHLGLDGTTLDPGDPNAYRCAWGGVITADGAEAEIATPPVRTRPGFTAQLQAWARTGEGELRRAVPGGIGLDGYSAHFSAAMPAKLNDRVCRLYAETFAADLMLLMDRIDSPGLLVRPRPGRTELCGEFIANEPLAAAAAFVAGTTRACAAAVRRPSRRTALPPRLDVQLARAVHRYGWYVDRRAFGADLHTASRRALLPRAAGGTICAQSHLELAWAAAQQALAEDAAASDLEAAEAMVTASRPLPAEHGQPDDALGGQHGGDAGFPLDGTFVPDTPRLHAHARPGFTLRPVAATWDFTVFEASGPARSAYACIPRDNLPGFVAALEQGELDDPIAAYLALTSRRRVLSAPGQTRRPGLYDGIGAPAKLLAPERNPQTGRQEPGEPGAKRTSARPGKRHRQDQEAPRKDQEASLKDQEAPLKEPRSLRRTAVIAASAAIVVVAAGAALAVGLTGSSSGHGHPTVPTPRTSGSQNTSTLPVITGTFPASGTTAGGTLVTIIGTHLDGPVTVNFGATAGTITVDLDTKIMVKSPPGQGTAEITVTTPAGTGKAGEFSYYSPSAHMATPTVTGVSPATGPAAGGTLVTINGTNLADATMVSFGGAAGVISSDSATQITVSSPPGNGTVDVIVTTPGGTAAAGKFTYKTTPPPPLKPPVVIRFFPPGGPATGGTTVTITGTNLSGATVSFGGTGASISSDSSTQITVTSPPHAVGTVEVTVTTPGGTSGPVQFTYQTPPPPPRIFSLSSDGGSTAGGTTVMIYGTNLSGATSVSFGGTGASISSDFSTQITVTSPPHAADSVNITVTTPGGSATSKQFFTYRPPPPIITAIFPMSGPTAGGTIVTITGTNLNGATSVSFGGAAATIVSDSSTRITAISPPNAAGTIDVVVNTTCCTSNGSSSFTAEEFTYISPSVTGISPASGPTAGGTIVTITGTNLNGATSVSFGGAAATIVSDSSTQITVTSPPHAAGSVEVTVTTPGGTFGAGRFTYLLRRQFLDRDAVLPQL